MSEHHLAELLARGLDRVVGVSPLSNAERLALQGVMTLSETSIVTTAHLAQRLGLPGASSEAALPLTDKGMQRSRLRAAGVDDQVFWLLDTGEDLARPSAEAQRYPGRPQTTARPRQPGGLVAADPGELLRLGAPYIDLEPYLTEGFLVLDPSCAGPSWAEYSSMETVSRGDVHSPLAVLGKGRLQEGFR